MKADKILATANDDEPYSCVVEWAYRKAGIPKAEFLVQVNVARILTADSYDFKLRRPIFWQT